MSNTLANLKACIPEFDPEVLLDGKVNIGRRWKQWVENFKCCITFEGVTDQPDAPSKKKTAPLAIAGQKLRELFSTLTPAAELYKTAAIFLKTHFTWKNTLTAERFKFFYTKQIDSDETHGN